MLLRSSSTPVLGSLLTSFSDSPNNNNHHHSETNTTTFKHPPTTIHHIHNKLPKFHQITGSLNLTSLSSNSSPISPSIAEFSEKGFRRAQSEGNLEGLAYASCNNNDEFYNSNQPHKFSSRPKSSLLQTIPSFSFYNSRRICEDDEEEETDEEGEFEDSDHDELLMERFVEGEEKVMAMGGGEKMGLVEEKGFKIDFGNVGYEEGREMVSEGMYISRGLGVCGGGGGGFGGGGGGSGGFTPGDSGGDGGMEEYYKRMVDENPSNPLFLRNYAQFLYQSKQDLQGAEEYYSRAILADPTDGDILSQYAKLVWELHHDEERASSYFDRAVQAAPEDSYVLAAHASFLWETEEDEDEESAPKDLNNTVMPLFKKEAMASARA